MVICGYGRNGKQAAIELHEHNVKVVIVEQNPDIVQLLRETPGMLYVEGDATDEEVLKSGPPGDSQGHDHHPACRMLITSLWC